VTSRKKAGQSLKFGAEYYLFFKDLNPLRRIRELMSELGRTRRECDQARKQVEQLEDEKQRLQEKVERLRKENERLRNQLGAALRAAKRQAAPFSRGKPNKNPKPPGRKSGKDHGVHHQRPVPDHVDEEIQVNAPAQCPGCGGPLTVERMDFQYQEEIVRRTWVRRFHIPVCRCEHCQKRVQGRHPLQTSDALGAAAVQVGPEAIALGVLMNKAQGLPHADAASILQQGFGLTMSRSGICRAIQPVARKAEATWHALRDAVRRSELAHMDETGWKVDAQWRWLWGVVTEQITYCQILPGRGFAQAASILGANYAGWLIHDGLRLYYKFLKAAHQSCAWHLIARCRKMATASPATARFPLAVKQLLEQALALRDRYLQQEISLHGLWTATGRLEAKLDRMLAPTQRAAANERLAKHLRHERPYLFTFLYCPGLVDATHNVAERVMRILVMIRKNWGGNRTEQGARVQAVLTSILCTAKQQDKDVFALLVDLLRSAKPKLLDILPTAMMHQPESQACSGEAPEIRESSDLAKPSTFLPPLDGLAPQQTAPPAIFNSA
jgi:transposase